MTSALAPPCKGPFERPDGGHHRGVNVGERGSRHARGKRRGIELVIGVERERNVEGANGRRVGPLTGEHVEEVRRVAHRRIGRNRSTTGL
jgi:hypothetical protein